MSSVDQAADPGIIQEIASLMPLVATGYQPDWTIADQRLRVGLRFLVAAEASGATADQVDAFVEDVISADGWADAIGTRFYVQLLRRQVPVSQRLESLGWALNDGSRLYPSSLGRALADQTRREASEVVTSERPELTDVVLEGDDPMVWPAIITRLASLKPYLLLDPYFDWTLLQRLRSTRLSRLLVGDEIKRDGRLAGLENAMPIVAVDWSVPIEVRVADKGVLHDRFIMDDHELWTIGTSLNRLGKSMTLLSKPQTGASQVRNELERIWNCSRILWPQQVGDGDS
ncbi:MAG: hypothetical protein R2761_00535 [Acidimicrobiales bacterium]